MNLAKANFFDSEASSSWATAACGVEDQPKIERLLAKAVIRPGAWVLEPGCGSGRLTEILADAVGSDGRVVIMDISPQMVAACRARSSRWVACWRCISAMRAQSTSSIAGRPRLFRATSCRYRPRCAACAPARGSS